MSHSARSRGTRIQIDGQFAVREQRSLGSAAPRAAMTRVTGDWNGPGTGFTITGAVAFIDTLVLLFSQRLARDEYRQLRRCYGRRMRLDPQIIPNLPHIRRWFLTLHQPQNETLEQLMRLRPGTFVVHAVHVAVDFLCADIDNAKRATEFLQCAVVQKWRRSDHCFSLEANCRYWKRDGKAPRNIALYGDRLSKPESADCAHLELRFTSAAACKRAGLGDLKNLTCGVDAMALLKRQTRLALIDEKRLDRAIEKISRRTVRKLNLKHGLNLTIREQKRRIQCMLARGLQHETRNLDPSNLASATAQELFDRYPTMRHCLVSRVTWEDFSPTPRWHYWEGKATQLQHIPNNIMINQGKYLKARAAGYSFKVLRNQPRKRRPLCGDKLAPTTGLCFAVAKKQNCQTSVQQSRPTKSKWSPRRVYCSNMGVINVQCDC